MIVDKQNKTISVSTPGDVEALKMEEHPIPTPKNDQVIVKNAFSGVNFVDIYQRNGSFPSKMPLVLGREAAGQVHSVGPNVNDFKVGDRVAYIGDGTYAQYTVVPTKSVIKVPEGVSLEEGAAGLLQAMTAVYLCCDSYLVQRGDWVLVTAAAGGTGGLITQMATALGAKVIGLCSTPAKAQLAKENGALHVLNPAEGNMAEEIMKITNGNGVQVFYDGTGKDVFQQGLQSLAKRGHYISFGSTSGKIGPLEPFDLSPKCLSFMNTVLFFYIDTKEEFIKSKWQGVLWKLT